MTFKENGLQEDIQLPINKLGYKEPAPVREKIIPQIIQNKQVKVAFDLTVIGNLSWQDRDYDPLQE